MNWKRKSKGFVTLSRISLEAEGVRRDGRWLHSQREPYREAGLWVSARPSGVQGLVFVLGLGAGYHLREWQRQRPDLCLVACDFDSELFQKSQIQTLSSFQSLTLKGPGVFGLHLGENSDFSACQNLLLRRGYSVFRFRPAWAGREIEFTTLEDELLDRHLKKTDQGETIEANIKSLTEARSLAELDPNEQKLLLALRELVA